MILECTLSVNGISVVMNAKDKLLNASIVLSEEKNEKLKTSCYSETFLL